MLILQMVNACTFKWHMVNAFTFQSNYKTTSKGPYEPLVHV